MAIDLAEKFLPYVDEQFTTESKKSLLTNNDLSWTGAHTIKVYKINTGSMNDYDRAGTNTGTNWSRYGAVESLDATTEEMTLKKDRSFTFAIDKLDTDETARQLAAASALARQNREVVIPEVDSYVYGVMADKAGHKPAAVALTAENIYTEILAASQTLDDAETPEVGRVLLVTPATYALMKKCPDIILDTDVGQNMRLKGVIGNLDGAAVVKVPSVRLPEKFGFMLAHPCATVAPTKLEDYTIHENPPGISGALVEGRIVYDAFVLDNKVRAIYYSGNRVTQQGACGQSSMRPCFIAKTAVVIYLRGNNGGWNKRHGTVERTPRIDSFEAGTVEGGNTLFAYRDNKTEMLECERFMDYGPDPEADREIVELWVGEWSQALELSRIPSGFGGSRAFWLCSACGGRVRYLYLAGRMFLCRKCAQVNYRSQQENRADSMYHYGKGMALVEKRLDTWPQVRPDGFNFCDWVPDRPRHMHQTTYRRYLARFLRYRKKHTDRMIKDMQRILRMGW